MHMTTLVHSYTFYPIRHTVRQISIIIGQTCAQPWHRSPSNSLWASSRMVVCRQRKRKPNLLSPHCGCALFTIEMTHRQQYTDEVLDKAVQRVCNGVLATTVSSQTRVPLRTLYKYVDIRRANALATPTRHGPPPVLTEDGERHIVEWVIGM